MSRASRLKVQARTLNACRRVSRESGRPYRVLRLTDEKREVVISTVSGRIYIASQACLSYSPRPNQLCIGAHRTGRCAIIEKFKVKVWCYPELGDIWSVRKSGAG